MLKKNLFFTLVFVLMQTLLFTRTIPAIAQTPKNDGTITLAQIEGAEIYLIGPYDSATVYFGLPADWKLINDAQLVLNFTNALSVVTTSNITAFYGGLLTVKINRQTVAMLPLNDIGTVEHTVVIPASYLTSLRSDGRMELRFELDSGISCQANQHMNVVINQSTFLTFPHDQIEPSTDLITFPRPIYQDTIYPDFALLVVPDNPTSAELQAAMSVAAGLGNLTSSNVSLDLTTVGTLTDLQKNNDHLIFVGQVSSLPDLADLILPLPVKEGRFSLTGSPDDGVVEMVNSPWNVSKVVMVVSGNTEAGVLKASQAISSGSLQSSYVPNLAIIDSVRDDPNPSLLIIDQTLADLGNNLNVLNKRGVESVEYGFYVPPGSTISSDSFFELAYSHSALLNMSLSGVVVLLNDQPIGSIQFTANTAAGAQNTMRFTLPQTLILPGTNRIDVRVSLEPSENCSDPSLESLYATIWPQSRLFMPFTTIQMDTISRLDLSNYPVPLSYDSTMSGLAFVLQSDDLNTWKSALQVARYLGDRSNGPISMPRVFIDGDFTDDDLANYNLIVMGIPSKMSFMNKLNLVLPVPFDISTDQVVNTYSQVTYRIPLNISQGYVELLTSPWNSEKLVLAALGNTAEGVTWAGLSLNDSPLRGQLAGNFAVINRTQVKTADTRLGQPPAEGILPTIEVPNILPSSNIDPAQPSLYQPAWLLPVFGVTVGISLLIVIIVLISNRRKRRS